MPAPTARPMTIAALVVALLAGPALASPVGSPLPGTGLAGEDSDAEPSATRTCAPHQTVTVEGTLGHQREGGFVLEPLEIPDPVNEVHLEASQDANPDLSATPAANTLDVGMRGPGPDAFRGWNAPKASFSAEEATRTYHRGPIEAGTWYVEIGAAAITRGTTSSYAVDVTCHHHEPAPEPVPWEPLREASDAVSGEAGWYEGDLHVHSRDSGDAPNSSTVRAILDAAHAADLDFLSLTDHNTDAHLDDLGTWQQAAGDEGLLLMPGTEVTTYRGHFAWHGGEAEFVDYRTGPVWIRDAQSGELSQHEAREGPDRALADARDHGSLTQVAHPTLLEGPVVSNVCRGCAWSYEQTDWTLVDLFEIQTGPPGLQTEPEQEAMGPNPFTATAIRMWEDLLAEGHELTAVGVSDDHRAGEPDNPTQSPIGTARTVVHTGELSQKAILEGLDAGNAYVRFWGQAGPHVELETQDGHIMGDTVDAASATMMARVEGGPDGQTLRVVHDGRVLDTRPVATDPFEHTFTADEPGRWRVEVLQGTSWQAFTNPIELVGPSPELVPWSQ